MFARHRAPARPLRSLLTLKRSAGRHALRARHA